MEQQCIGKDATCEFSFLIIFILVFLKLACQFIITACLFLFNVRMIGIKLSVVVYLLGGGGGGGGGITV